MANVMICFPNRGDAATLAGGNWQSPLNRLQTRLLSDVARSSGLALGNTKFTIDLNSTRLLTVVALVRHNIGVFGRYRLSIGSSSGGSDLYSSGWQDVWPTQVPIESLEWESDRWWTGRMSDEELVGYPAALVHVMPVQISARYCTLEIDDQYNPAGYIEAGRLYLAERWQPVFNASWGGSLGFETDTVVTASPGGVDFFDERPPYRVSRFSLDFMRDAEALGVVLEMQRQLGVSRDLFLLWDADDIQNRQRHSYLGRLRQLSPIEMAGYDRRKTTFEIKELL